MTRRIFVTMFVLGLAAAGSGAALGMRPGDEGPSGPAIEAARNHIAALKAQRGLPLDSDFVVRRAQADDLGHTTCASTSSTAGFRCSAAS